MSSENDKFERELEAFLSPDGSRATALYRKLPRPEPDAKIDAAVLSMAQRALNPELVAVARASIHQRRVRWLPALGAAAGLVLAAGVALHVSRQMWTQHDASAPSATSDNAVIQVRTLDEPPPPPESPPPPVAATARETAAPAQRPAGGVTNPTQVMAKRDAAKAAPVATASAPVATTSANLAQVAAQETDKSKNLASRPAAQALRGRPPSASEMDAVERKQAIAAGAWQTLPENVAREAAVSRANADAANSNGAAESSTLANVAPPSTAASAAAPPAPAVPAAPPAPMQAQSMVSTASPPPFRAPAPAMPVASTPTPLAPTPGVVRPTPPLPPREAPALAPMPASTAAPAPTAAAAFPADVDSKKSQGAASEAAATPAPQPMAAAAAVPRSVATPDVPAESRQPDEWNGAWPKEKPPYPQMWIPLIERSLREHRRDEALKALDEFRKKYPRYLLPADLRDLK